MNAYMSKNSHPLADKYIWTRPTLPERMEDVVVPSRIEDHS
jgi:hypothetical protein